MKTSPLEVLELLDDSKIRKRCGKGRCLRFKDGEPNDGMLCSGQVAVIMVGASRDIRGSQISDFDEKIDAACQGEVNDYVADSLLELGRTAGMAAESCEIHLTGTTALINAGEIEMRIASARSSSSDICDSPMTIKDGKSFT